MQEENIYQAMFKHATIGIVIVKSDGKIIKANAFAEKLFGYSQNELEGQSVDVLVPNALRSRHAHHRNSYHKRPVERVMGAGLDLFAKRKNGETFPVEISLGHTEFNGEKIAIAYINNIAVRKKERETAQMYLDIAGSMMVVIDTEEKITLLNQRGEEVLGVSAQEVVGKNWFELFISNEEREEVRTIFRRLMDEKEKNVEYFENYVLTKNGDKRLIWWHNRVLLNEKDEVQGTISSGVDITEQKATEALNRDISKIVEESLNEIFIFEEDSLKFVQVNEGGRKNLGYTQEELNNLTPIDIKPEFDKNTFLKLVEPLVNEQQERLIFKTIHERKDKTTYPVEIHLQYASLGGKPVFVAIVVDITKQRNNEAKILEYSQGLERKVKERTSELEKSQLKLTEAQSIAKMGHWDFFPSEDKVVFSKGMYQIYGLPLDSEPSIDLVNSLIHQEDIAMVNEEINRAIQNKKSISILHRILLPKGKLKYVRSNIQAPVFDDKGKLIKLFGVLKDITLEKESELQLHEALNKEKELGLLKSRFVSMASHEFRTPLSSILSSAELIEMYIQAGKLEKTGKNISRIKNSVRNLTGILNDFLSLEKLEAGKIEVQRTEINLTEFLDELHEEIKPILLLDQELLFNISVGESIQLDPYLLKNILINLLSNAIKYSPNATPVTLTIVEEKDKYIFKVIDNGIGIPEGDKQHMFSRFFRASNVENIKGTGLGLTIVKRYLDLMGGEIGFESDFGKGTTFFFYLPK